MLKQITLGFFSFLIFINSFAQKSIDGLIQAEKSFAAFSVTNSTKEAFLKFLDSNGIVFSKQKPVNGIQVWSAREKRSGVLNWWPQYAEIAASNDFGYTTGPWTFQSSLHDSIEARGNYTTIWHTNNQGEWKFLLDLGIDNTPASHSKNIKKISAKKTSIKQKDTLTLIAAEKDFLKLYKQNIKEAYKKYLSEESILNRMGHLSAVNETDQKIAIDLTSSSIQYTIDGWGISNGLDMGYVYGTTLLNSKSENYQRIWRHEKNGWKIALEVLRQ